MGKDMTRLNCRFCGTVCKNFLKHLKKYHEKHITPFPQTEREASRFFKRRFYH